MRTDHGLHHAGRSKCSSRSASRARTTSFGSSARIWPVKYAMVRAIPGAAEAGASVAHELMAVG
ncbi:hypothetical protein [Streptomyces sp. NPDC048411]|uniref:hypothetical protein n=1 Tax=Streptomyces sp. NPDC048411 TaxID=3157206 RepID=UPI003452594D